MTEKSWPSFREGLAGMDRYEIYGGLAGMLGNTFVSLANDLVGWGFVLFLISNFFLIQVFWKNRMPVLVIMTLWYSLWSANGVLNYFGT